MNAKCEMRKKMMDMKEAADQGETNESPEEIHHKVRDAEYLGKWRRKAHLTPFSLYQKKEEEIAQMKIRIASMEREYPVREFKEYEEEEVEQEKREE
ncbi:hypothetical protein MKX01_006053 [Papaver californicum]|nr:hypothetical protein MKX01_006053 [Papaver californicum]